ncbi:LytR/AlgR family response regulator transcription factor [Enterococcus ureasiticus]|nr:LytTR family DNA-binding domain-containing protein [Enterococcus ureasiticus]
MLSVIVCEDDPKQRERIETTIKNYLMIEDLDMELTLSTGNPEEVMEHVKANQNQIRLYFFDVDLQHEMSGIALAYEIRKLDNVGKIVFVTTHGEMSYLTFTYKIEAMDYIIKDIPEEIDRRVRECINVAHQRYLSDSVSSKVKSFKVKMGDTVRSIPYDEIMFFESSTVPHKLILHTETRELEFYGAIRDIEANDECLYRCHKSFVVNKNNIKTVNKRLREIEMTNGETVLVSVRAMRGLN